MTTLRKLLSENLREGEEGLESLALNSSPPYRYLVTFRHKKKTTADFNVEVTLGQDKEVSAEKVFEILHRELSDWYQAQEDYQVRHTSDIWFVSWGKRQTEIPKSLTKDKEVAAYVLYCLDNFGRDSSLSTYREWATGLKTNATKLKLFFGEDWYRFAELDFRSHAFHYKPESQQELPIAIFQFRDPNADEWVQVTASIWYGASGHGQAPSMSVTSQGATREDPEGGSFGATIREDLAWSPAQRERITRLERWHLCNILGQPMHMVANTRYHIQQDKIAYAKSSYCWGNLADEVFEDDTAFLVAVGNELAEDRFQKLRDHMWQEIIGLCDQQFRPTLSLLHEYVLADKWQAFFSEKQHLKKERG